MIYSLDYQLPIPNVKDTKPPQQPVQYTVGKKSFAAIIILLVIIIFLLVAILVLNLISKDTFMSTCTSNASSNSAGLTNSGNTAINNDRQTTVVPSPHLCIAWARPITCH